MTSAPGLLLLGAMLPHKVIAQLTSFSTHNGHNLDSSLLALKSRPCPESCFSGTGGLAQQQNHRCDELLALWECVDRPPTSGLTSSADGSAAYAE